MPMRHYRLPGVSLTSLVCAFASLLLAAAARAEVPLTRAEVEALHNRVELIPQDGSTRPARLSDWLSLGDAIRTAAASRTDLRFNDGSLARIGEQATFWFVPNTRNFRLSNGTALFLVPPGRGPSTIETPSAITGIQGTAVVVRHVPAPGAAATLPPTAGEMGTDATGRTVVMALTNNPGGPVTVTLVDGRTVDLTAGQMAVINQGDLYVFDFDLALFYETSPLVQDLYLNDPSYPDSGLPTDPVRQETLEGLSQQTNFIGEYLLNPEFLNPATAATTDETNWLFVVEPTAAADSAATAPGETPQAVPSAPTADSLPAVSTVEPASPDTHSGAAGGRPDLLPPGQMNPTPDNAPNAPGGGVGNTNALPPGLLNPTPDNAPSNGDGPGRPENPGNSGNGGPPDNPGNSGNGGPPENPGNTGDGGPPGNPNNSENAGPPGNPGNSGNAGPPNGG